MDNLKQKTFKAFRWDFIGRLGNQGLSFLMSVILARLLSPADFGLISIVSVIIAMSNIFVETGLGSALLQRQDVRDTHYGSVFYFNIVVGGILTIVLFFSSGYIATFFNKPEINLIAKVMSLSFILNAFGTVRRLWLYKNLNYKIPTQSSLIGMIFGGFTGVIMAYKGCGVWSLVAQTLISSISSNFYIYFATKWKPKLVFEFKALVELWQFGIHIFLSGIVENIFSQTDKLIIGKLFPTSTLGYYYRAKSFDFLVNNFTCGTIMSVIFPVLSNIQNDEQRFKRVIYKAFHLLNFITFLLLGVLYLCAKDIIIVLFSSKWLPSIEYYKILVLSSFAFPFSALLLDILQSKGNSKAFFKVNILKKIPVFLCFIFGFKYGLNGFLIGLGFSNCISLILNIYYASNEMNVNVGWFYKIIYKYIICWIGIITGLSFLGKLFIINNSILHLILNSIIFSITFILVSVMLKLEGLEIIKIEINKSKLITKFKKTKYSIFSK